MGLGVVPRKTSCNVVANNKQLKMIYDNDNQKLFLSQAKADRLCNKRDGTERNTEPHKENVINGETHFKLTI